MDVPADQEVFCPPGKQLESSVDDRALKIKPMLKSARLLLICGIVFNAGVACGQIPEFRHEIMPVFSKAGCNAGACHGAGNGKGNLKLSLRGENPLADFAELTKSRNSKRLNVDNAEASDLLRKPAELTEHEGGRRFGVDSEEYRLLREWIAAGAPADAADTAELMQLTVSPPEAAVEGTAKIPLRVTAHFSDTTQRDVTEWAVYEPSNLLAKVSRDGQVTPQRTGETTVVVRFEHLQTPVPLVFLPPERGAWPETPEHNVIDTHVYAKLRRTRLQPSAVCDDVTFLRRVYFDLSGLPPGRAAAESFLNSNAPNKRARLVDEVLERQEYADWWAMKWADLLRVDERILDVTGTLAFHKWLRDGAAADKPFDQFTRELITALGSTYQNPPANFYRALRDATTRSESVAQLFLGTRLACAKCHNHPFERWTQDDYYRFAAVFDGIDYKIIENKRKDDNDKMEFVGEQLVQLAATRELKDPRSKGVPAPGLLDGGAQPLDPGDRRLEELAAWMTSPQHPLFARVMVNRVWAQLMGKGIVDPVDDFRMTNPPSNPALLNALAEQFVRDGFRQKNLLRLICNSRTYQLSSEPGPANRDDETNFSRAIVRRLPAESLLDAIYAALGLELKDDKFPGLQRAGQIPGARFITKSNKRSHAESFLKDFGKPPRATVCECERVNTSTLSQVFSLTSGPVLHEVLRKKGNLIDSLLEKKLPPQDCLSALFWQTLSRPPSAAESAKLLEYLTRNADLRAGLEDVAWSLVNSKEFLLRH